MYVMKYSISKFLETSSGHMYKQQNVHKTTFVVGF